jgi:hypothetical protein
MTLDEKIDSRPRCALHSQRRSYRYCANVSWSMEDAAVLYCRIFLYFAFAGGGPWTTATLFRKRAGGEPRWHSARAAR